jgi:hypothetical protein
MPAKIYRIALTQQERVELRGIADAGSGSKERRRRAKILLLADEGAGGPAFKDADIMAAEGCRSETVAKVRKRCFESGVEACVERRLPPPRHRRKLDGRGEAELFKIACGPAPQGHARWSLRLLADRLVELEVVDAISHSTVGEALKKTRSAPGS